MTSVPEIIHVLSKYAYGGSKQVNISTWQKTDWVDIDGGKEKKRELTDPRGVRFFDYCAPGSKHKLIRIDELNPTIPNPTQHNPTTPNSTQAREYEIKALLMQPRPNVAQIKSGIHNGMFYFGTVVYQGNRPMTAVVTSDRKIYVDWSREKNEIRDVLNLNYRYPFEHEVLDGHWSTEGVHQYLYGEEQPKTIKEMYEQILRNNIKFMYYPQETAHKLVALDILATYFMPLFEAHGRSFLEAEPGSGKTRQCVLYKLQACNAVMSADISKSSFFRLMESSCSTLIVDDFDNIGDEQKNDVLQHYKTGYKNSSKSVRTSDTKTKRIDAFRNYGHVVMNNTTGLDAISAARTKFIRVLKTDNPLTKANLSETDPAWQRIRDDLFISALHYWKEVQQCYMQIQSNFSGRQFEISRSVLALAHLVSPELQAEIERYLTEVYDEQDTTDPSTDWGVLVLQEFVSKQEGENVPLAAIANSIAAATLDADDKSYKARKHGMAVWLGKHLKNNPLFQQVKIHGVPHYRLVSREKFESYLKAKGWDWVVLGSVQNRVSLEEVVEYLRSKNGGQGVTKQHLLTAFPKLTEDQLGHWLTVDGRLKEVVDGWVMCS